MAQAPTPPPPDAAPLTAAAPVETAVPAPGSLSGTLRPHTMGNAIAPWRYVIFAILFAAGLILGAILNESGAKAVMIAFDIAAFVFLLTLIPLCRPFTAAQMREQARRNDANRNLLLVLALGVSTVIFIAVGYEVVAAHRNLAIVIVTLAIAWFFGNAMFGLHYAHNYYMHEERQGLKFSGTEAADYNDFFYFAFTLGMTSQTSDVIVTTRSMRRLVLSHSLAAYLFNLGAIAFTVNTIG